MTPHLFFIQDYPRLCPQITNVLILLFFPVTPQRQFHDLNTRNYLPLVVIITFYPIKSHNSAHLCLKIAHLFSSALLISLPPNSDCTPIGNNFCSSLNLFPYPFTRNQTNFDSFFFSYKKKTNRK
jgi:hypothetical protein